LSARAHSGGCDGLAADNYPAVLKDGTIDSVTDTRRSYSPALFKIDLLDAGRAVARVALSDLIIEFGFGIGTAIDD